MKQKPIVYRKELQSGNGTNESLSQIEMKEISGLSFGLSMKKVIVVDLGFASTKPLALSSIDLFKDCVAQRLKGTSTIRSCTSVWNLLKNL